MCTFITAVLPASADADAVAAIFRAHGRAFIPGAMYATHAVFLAAGERAFHTTLGHCDCGTPLGRATLSSDRDPSADMTARLRRKGWSEAKSRARSDSARKPMRDRRGPVASLRRRRSPDGSR